MGTSNRRKIKYTQFKKHYFIPMILSVVIILIGIYMTFTNTVSGNPSGMHLTARGYKNIGGGTITGPGAIGLGVVVFIILLIAKKKKITR